MESNKVEQLLEAYFEGATTLAQEKQLRDYFTSTEVAPHLEDYVGMFSAFAKAQEETYNLPIEIPKPKRRYGWISGVAAVAIVVVGLTIQLKGDNDAYTGTYEDPEVAVLKTKQALGLVTKMFNESTAQLGAVNEFNSTTSNFFKK